LEIEQLSEFPPLQYSLFIGKDQLVIRASNVSELVDIFDTLNEPYGEEPDAESAFSRILNRINELKASGLLVVNPALDLPNSGPRNAASAPAPTYRSPATPSPDAPMCSERDCGRPLTKRSGEKNGKLWSGWFCDVKGHKVIWNK
jgi:hypothetical protein